MKSIPAAMIFCLALTACGSGCRDDRNAVAAKNSAPQKPAPPRLMLDHTSLRANGLDRATAALTGGDAHAAAQWSVQSADAQGADGGECVQVIDRQARQVTLQATLAPCRVRIRTRAQGRNLHAEVTVHADTSDADADGFPDVAELTADNDRKNFRAWFTAIAESQFTHMSDAWPPEKRDCAGLVRFAYSEALKRHDTGDGTFQPFVIARLLQEANTHFVSRNLEDALPGDLLFFLRFAESAMPYHSMVYLGAGPGEQPRLVYHTGPVDGSSGRIKLITVADLMAFPDMRWHPAPENDNFLGVYRFNILD